MIMASIKKDKKTGTWYYRVSYKDSDGKYRTKTKKGFKTKLEAQVEAGKLENRKHQQEDLSNDKDLTIFANYFEEWVDTYVIGKYSEKTDVKYRHQVKLVKEFFKLTPLTQLSRTQYQKFINLRGENSSRDTVHKTHNAIKKCLSYALADGLIKKDPTFGVVLRWSKDKRSKLNYLNYNESILLRDYLIQNFNLMNFMLLICLETGLRLGEVYGLSYQDFSHNTLSISRGYDHQLTYDFTKGKTASSIRTIAISFNLYNLMKQHQLMYQKMNNTYLFLNKRNRPATSHSHLLKHFKKISAELSLPIITIHGLRHTHASVLIFKHFNITYISKRLGHSNITQTLNTYSHLLNELEQTQNEEVVKLYGSSN